MNQRECGMSEAIELCLKNGGRMKRKDDYEPYYWYGKSYFNDVDEYPVFTSKDVIAVWIYEGPPKSSFEIWNDNRTKLFGPPYPTLLPTLTRGRREGWNGALDEAIELVVGGDYGTVCKKDLEHLKDK